ncbi:MAG TPA: cyclic nucleotide-binding domain-containing protein [Candidatus Limnocylindrales bacterium]|nr:cyclic nucleotide-binding domain-containing protein [Candidatus Limnocylindrales bacterium]
MSVTRYESSVTAISWIPAEAIEGLSKIPFEMGVTHYDAPPPDRIGSGDLEELRKADRFREANELRAWIDVEDGRIVGQGYLGGGKIGATTVRVGPAAIRFAAVHLPDIQKEPEVGPSSVRFVQTVGGRMGIPTPRPVKRRPFVQFWPSIAWSTLELTINADGTSSRGLAGASPFPRHWVYDEDGRLLEQSAVIDFRSWADHCFGDGTPWGSYDSERLTSATESALERELNATILRGGLKPKVRVLDEGATLTTQGEAATDVYVVIDGQFDVQIDGASVAEIGPGAVVGERAALEGGLRTATLRATTRARVAAIPPDELNRDALEALQETRRTQPAGA